MDFDETLERHLAAVRDRDLMELDATLHDQVTVLLADGTLYVGRDEVLNLHRSWFADTEWSISFRLVARTVLPRVATVLLDVHYLDVDASGEPVTRDYFLGLTFAHVQGAWELVLDQNTVPH